jgi:hypothetical protein
MYRMKFIINLCLLFGIGCAVKPPSPSPNQTPAQVPSPPPQATPGPDPLNIYDLQNKLGLVRSPTSLGYAQKGFDGCKMGVRTDEGKCGQRFLSVVHFQLLCRDSVGTTEIAPVNFKPLVAGKMQWRLAGEIGATHTDSEGFGQVQLVSTRSTKGKRFILIIGSKSLGLEVGEVSKIILPGNWCSHVAATPHLDIAPMLFAAQPVQP